MPLKRYEIRNEYSLADPDLYRAADKDDPEALLEGVAMAGLVGVLRQLGDLAEFAAEIFHNLHEEVMATSARGHGLTLRVQQLEAEFPSLEKAFLSQTSHSLFLHNPGVVWHPNLKLDQSLITQGDLPRFVMDSYEECRGPPRLFLLDKFDVAGAGACLKRYTDPSFFKAEFTSSEAAKEELKREKKARKIKKKGSRWRPGENPELAASHFKLHQLLLEERYESQNNVHMHRVKLKRRYSDNCRVNSVSGKSYMEKFVNNHSRDGKYVSGSSVRSRLKMGFSDHGLVPESEIIEKSSVDHLGARDRNLMQSHSIEEKVLEASSNELLMDDERNSFKFLESAPETELESTFYKVEDKKELVVNATGNTEASADEFHSDDTKELVVNATGNTEVSADEFHSDDANSDIENYTDALATMDSEMETDTESKHKKNVKIERKCVENEEKPEFQVQFPDSRSVGSSISSYEANDSLEKVRFSPSYSDPIGNEVEITLSDAELAAKAHPSTVSQYVDISSKTGFEARNDPVTRSPEHAVPNGSSNEASEIPSYSSTLREASSDSDVANIPSGITTSSPAASLSDFQLFLPNSITMTPDVIKPVSGQISPNSEDGVGGGRDLSYMTSVFDIPSQSKHDFLSEGPHESQTVEMLKGGNLVSSNGISVHRSDIMDATHEDKGVNGDAEESYASGVADSHNGTQILGKLSSPDSVLLNTEEEVYGLAGKDFEASPGTRWVPECRPDPLIVRDMNGAMPHASVSNLEEIVPFGDKSEYLASVASSPKILNLREQDDSKITDHALSPEMDIVEVGVGHPGINVSSNKLESKMSDCSSSEMETSCNKEFNISDYEVKDGHAADVDVDNVLPLECTSSYSTKSVTSEEVPLEVANSNAEANVVQWSPIGSSNEEACLDMLETTETSTANHSEGERKMENEPVTSDFSINHCTPELADEAHDPPMVKCTLTHLDVPEGADVPLSTMESNFTEALNQCLHEKETLLASSVSLEAGALLDGQTLLDSPKYNAREDHLCPLQLKVERIEFPSNDYEHAETLDHIHSDSCSTGPSKSSSMDPLSQMVDLNTSSRTSYDFERSMPSVFPMQPTYGGFAMHPNLSNQLPLDPRHRSIPDGSLSANDAVPGDVEEMPPLPPLPPMQWRVGKFRHDSNSSRGEIIQPILNALPTKSGEAVDLAAPPGFQIHDNLADPPKPFLQDLPSNAKDPEVHSEEVVQGTLSLSPLMVSAVEQNPMLEPTIVNPLSPLPLTSGDLQHGLSNSGDEKLEPATLGPLTPASTTVNSNIQHVLLTAQEELEQSLDSLAAVKNDEKHKLLHAFSDTEHVSTTSTTIENNEHWHYSQTMDGELNWQSNTSAVSSIMDYWKPNGSLKARLARPRDPLIEAVASHDKRNLRKVTERVIPQNGPEVDERNSLLEQIRTKSFSLKPAVATRPSIHGPKTNLKVVAILEKANAIRQALAGSDEDDDDSWSDS